MAVYLAIDLGTTGCRSILFDSELRQLADSYQEYGLVTPREKWAEQDAQLWWELTVSTAREAIRKSGRSGLEVDGISVSSQGITVVPVDREFHPLSSALSWLDTRAEEQTARLEKEIGSRRLFTTTGKLLSAAYTLPKLLWIRENQPEIFRSAWKFLMPMDFLIGKLTGKAITDHTMASETMLYDVRSLDWCPEILEKYGIPAEKLPELRWSGEPAGTVTAEAAEAIGLRKDCMVAVGAQDQRCASLGAGLKDGVMTISLGTAGAICKLWNEAKTGGDMRIPWSAYVHDGTWVTQGVINTAGVCMRWLRDTMFPGVDYDAMDAEAGEALRRGSPLLFFPVLTGPTCPDNYPDSAGCFYGVSLAAKRGDFALAVMEGVAFQIRTILDAMDAFGNVHTLVLFGGGSKSPLWCQIIADATGMKITVPESAEAAGAGAAVLAGLGCGEFRRGALPCAAYKKFYEPKNSERYQEKYEKYRAVEHRLWAQQKGV